ncbi:2662_t:CDS:1 [Paraglomus brasilianum]|uniref:2662_t:CDS:1 n=1 Tax=Paraglomus brasilianum TaxID=144538 RepID=A0A9N9D6J6_9GLOM|nr:2662_t:CDS:1 [Paraglomus brasilianum]
MGTEQSRPLSTGYTIPNPTKPFASKLYSIGNDDSSPNTKNNSQPISQKSIKPNTAYTNPSSSPHSHASEVALAIDTLAQFLEEANRTTIDTRPRSNHAINPSRPSPYTISKQFTLVTSPTPPEHAAAVSVKQRATQLSCFSALSKLGLDDFRGINNSLSPDRFTAAMYFVLALKLLVGIPACEWDMDTVAEVNECLTELYRYELDETHDKDIWHQGILYMKEMVRLLQDRTLQKLISKSDDVAKRRILIHILFCLGHVSSLSSDHASALKYYSECEKTPATGDKKADKLRKKAHTNVRLIEPKVPKVKPACVSCGFEPQELKEIWALLVCSKCQAVAVCDRECLKKHLSEAHESK